jgi:single-stranded DNA-binding protein
MKELQLIGNLGDDAQIIDKGQNSFLCFNLAVNQVSKGEKQTHWFRCYYNARKEHLKNIKMMFKKGQKLLIKGDFTTQIYKEKVVINVYFSQFNLL